MARELHHMGGSERQLTEIALGLDPARFEPHVGTFRPRGLRGDQLLAAGIPVVQFPVYSFRSWAALAGVWQLRNYIHRHGIRIVHTFDAPLTTYAMPVTRYLTRAAAVSSQRGHRGLTPEYRRLLRWTDHMVRGIVVNCQYLKDHLVSDEGVPDRLIHVCYNGIDLAQFRRGTSPRPAVLPPDSFVIGVICALRPEKGLNTLVEAFAMVRSLKPCMKLVVAGSGPVLPALQRQAEAAGISADCIWEPATSEVARWLSAFDIFVLPSLNEAFSNSLMEAMACGCAVAASSAGGNPELVSHGERGLLFEPGNAVALADALRQLIEDDAFRRKMASAGESFLREGFSRTASATRMGEIYEELLRDPIHK